MTANTKIQWCHHTFNPWRGCTKVSPGCAHCYAETLSHRNPKVLGVWGENGTRPIAVEAYWRQPIRWNRDAAAAGERRRVFCASLADVFEDRADLVEPRARLFALIAATPSLDWLLLTKRPENIRPLMAQLAESGYDGAIEGAAFVNGAVLPNVWWGTTVEDQERADRRIPHLLAIPAAIRFLSLEPLLESVDVRAYLHLRARGWTCWLCGFATNREEEPLCPNCGKFMGRDRRVDWLIVGGESGGGARPLDLEWTRSLREQCLGSGVAVFMKQHGAVAWDHGEEGKPGRYVTTDKKGGDPDEWPLDLRVREFPATAARSS